jgi:hypothetical protein
MPYPFPVAVKRRFKSRVDGVEKFFIHRAVAVLTPKI